MSPSGFEGPGGSDLSSLQRWMARLIQRPHSLAKENDFEAVAAQHFTGSSQLSPAEQIDIYRQQFWLRHRGALREDFPGLLALLGPELWERVVTAYLESPCHLTLALRDLGHGLAAHLEQFPALPQRELCVDMARLEWAYVDVFGVPDEPPLDAERVRTIAPEAWPGARIVLSSAVRLLSFDFPVPDHRRRLRASASKETPLPPPERLDEPGFWVIYRRQRSLWDKPVSEPAFRLLEQLAAGVPLVPACEAVVQRLPDAASRLEQELFTWFSLWGRLGWIVDVVV